MQATSDKTASANFTQTGESVKIRDDYDFSYGKTGYAPYYEWGRKDAFRSAQHATDVIYSATSVTVGATIKNPTTFYSNGNNPYNASFYYNAWNATGITYYGATADKIDVLEKVVKTVYDPCPVGYTVPPANTFSVFNTTNFPADGTGRYYTNNGKTLYFPYTGYRAGSASGAVTSPDKGWSWLAVASNTSNSCHFICYPTEVHGNAEGGGRMNGFNMHPVSENIRQR